jgi:hypothetical protein
MARPKEMDEMEVENYLIAMHPQCKPSRIRLINILTTNRIIIVNSQHAVI